MQVRVLPAMSLPYKNTLWMGSEAILKVAPNSVFLYGDVSLVVKPRVVIPLS